MKIGIAAPVALKLLSNYVTNGDRLPVGYSFPPIATLVQEYLKRGHAVSLFALDPTTTQLRTFRGERLTIHVGQYRPHHRARDFFAVERADLLAAMKSDPCHIIHAHWTYEFALAAIASGSPYAITAHDAPLEILRLNCIPYRFMRTLMSFQVARKAQNLTAVSTYVANHFQKVLGYSKPIKVIPNGLPESIFALGERQVAREAERLTFATVLTGWGGRKNGQVALQAFKRVREVLPQARLLMFGNGHGEGEPASVWARQQEIDRGVEFVGTLPYLELLKRLAAEVDVLVHPALEESFSMAIAEAMALGIPAIGGVCSGAVPSTLENGRVGILTNIKSAQSVAAAMLSLAQNFELRTALGQTARNSAWQRFHVEKVVNAYENLYEQTLTKSTQPLVQSV